MDAITASFLFTDIEGSTRLWDTQPDAMKLALARHDALMRRAIEQEGGIVFKTVGDAFCAMFRDPHAAVAAALVAQRSLAQESWKTTTSIRVRMAIHTGVAEARDEDYFGPPLNRVARLLSIGHGGQTLLSLATVELIRDQLPPTLRLTDRGSHRLKDLARPEQVFEVSTAGEEVVFPPLRSLDNLPNNLPQQLTSFIGREDELMEVKRLLTAGRMVTLAGAGGSGKTRLALQAGADLLEGYPDGVWLVELAGLSEPTLVTPALAAALSVREEPGTPLAATLATAIKGRQLLLILDNCEHLIESCAGIVNSLLQACAQLTILATSREPLGILGETVYRVPSLRLPLRYPPPTLEKLSQFAAVQLFLDRAQSVRSDFVVTNANAPAVAEVCWRLDGIPLAIELAAARLRSMSVEDLLARLEDRFRLLTSGNRTSLPRQQTLRALIDWSYNLLNTGEQKLLDRLCVFRGGFTLEAAEGVCSGDGVEDWEVMDLLASLVDKSLVLFEEPRYRLLETVREYAQERLTISGAQDAFCRRHRDYYLAVHEANPSPYYGLEDTETLGRVTRELDNYRAALAFSATDAEGGMPGLKLAVIPRNYWYQHSAFSEGIAAIERALAHPGAQEPTVERAWALASNGMLHNHCGRLERGEERVREGMALHRLLGNESGVADALSHLGISKGYQGDFPEALQYWQESLDLHRKLGNTVWAIAILINLGFVLTLQKRYQEAEGNLSEALQFSHLNVFSYMHCLENLGFLHLAQGDLEKAWIAIQEAMNLAWEKRQHERLLTCLIYAAALFARWDESESAFVLAQTAQRIQQHYHIAIAAQDQELLEHLRMETRINLDLTHLAALEAETNLPLEQQIAGALQRVQEREPLS